MIKGNKAVDIRYDAVTYAEVELDFSHDRLYPRAVASYNCKGRRVEANVFFGGDITSNGGFAPVRVAGLKWNWGQTSAVYA